MKLINKTNYDNDNLKDFVRACIKDTGLRLASELLVIAQKKKRNWIEIRNDESPKGISGCAHLGKVYSTRYKYHGYHVTLRIPPIETLKKRSLAFVVCHELLHCEGFHHRELGNMRQYDDWTFAESDKFAFADNLPMNPRMVNSPKPKKDVRKIRYEQALRKVKIMESRFKRTKNLLKKWQNKVKYYEKNKV